MRFKRNEEDYKELTEKYRNNNNTQKNSFYFLNGIIESINLKNTYFPL